MLCNQWFMLLQSPWLSCPLRSCSYNREFGTIIGHFAGALVFLIQWWTVDGVVDVNLRQTIGSIWDTPVLDWGPSLVLGFCLLIISVVALLHKYGASGQRRFYLRIAGFVVESNAGLQVRSVKQQLFEYD